MDSVPFAPDMRTNEGADSTILTSSLLLAVGNRWQVENADEDEEERKETREGRR